MFRVEKIGSSTVIRDNPIFFWCFYLFFVLAGAIAVWIGLFDSPDRTTTVIATVVGVGNIWGGFYCIQQEPFSVVEVYTEKEEVRIFRQRPFSKVRKVYSFDEIELIFVEIGEHTNGGKIYRPSLQTTSHGTVPVSFLWSQENASAKRVVDALARALPEKPVAL